MDLFFTSASGVSRCVTTSAMEPLLPMVPTAGDTLTATKLCGQSCGRHNFAPNNQPRPTCIVCKLQHTKWIHWLIDFSQPVLIFFCIDLIPIMIYEGKIFCIFLGFTVLKDLSSGILHVWYVQFCSFLCVVGFYTFCTNFVIIEIYSIALIAGFCVTFWIINCFCWNI